MQQRVLDVYCDKDERLSMGALCRREDEGGDPLALLMVLATCVDEIGRAHV